ncbi:MAG: hypothetical protein FWH08_06690 [Oscillospiraceae bacterium]|nr:hypothetical protein [Oscillospiraceae bacterium]
MQRKSFLKLFLETMSYVLAGNILALVVTITLAGFSAENNIIMGIAAFLSVTLFLTFMFSAAHKDGEQERKLITRNQIETPEPNKWFFIGIIVWLLLCIPCIALIFSPGFLNIFRFVMASVMALSFLIEDWKFAPFVYMGVYALTPVACRLGHYIGFYEKWSVDGLVYKNKGKEK